MTEEEKPAEKSKPEKKPASGGKRVRTGRKHESKSPKDYYEIHGNEISRKRKICPRCGDGTFLAKHKDRQYCGKCGYTIFEGKGTKSPVQSEAPEEKPKEEQPEKKEDE